MFVHIQQRQYDVNLYGVKDERRKVEEEGEREIKKERKLKTQSEKSLKILGADIVVFVR